MFISTETPMLDDADEGGVRLWHLVKGSEEPELPKHRRGSLRDRERAKAIPEIYLTRLLSMKVSHMIIHLFTYSRFQVNTFCIHANGRAASVQTSTGAFSLQYLLISCLHSWSLHWRDCVVCGFKMPQLVWCQE